jgi:hypothetical protein
MDTRFKFAIVYRLGRKVVIPSLGCTLFCTVEYAQHSGAV